MHTDALAGGRKVDYDELVTIADRLLEQSDEDDAHLARLIGRLAPDVRDELLVSDLLNARQVFLYCFRDTPSELEAERLIFSAASELRDGVAFGDRDLYTLVFAIDDNGPAIRVTDGEAVLASFSGPHAYRDAVSWIDEHY
jgi:hypothetical protein